MSSISIDASKARALSEQCIAMLCDAPNVNLKLLDEASGGKIAEGNGAEHCKVLVNALRWMQPSPGNVPTQPTKQRKKRKANGANGEAEASPAIKKRRGRPPRNKTDENQAAEAATVTEETASTETTDPNPAAEAAAPAQETLPDLAMGQELEPLPEVS